jgi:NADPH:quinone reductase
MDAWQCNNATGVDDLRWGWVPTPDVNRGEVLIEIHAASLNFPDLLMVQGKYQYKPELPFVPGAEFSGTIIGAGPDVKHVRVGQSVACLSGTGAFSTHAVVNAELCVPLPVGFAFADAAAFIMTFATAHHALVDRAQLKKGETVLILGAAGGVGTAAIQVAKRLGARVIAASSSAAKCEACRALRADVTIDTSKDDLRAAIKFATNGKGPDVIVDPVGGAQTEVAFRSIAWRGRHLVIGFAAGDIPALPLNLTLLKGASLVGVFWGDYAKREPAAAADMLLELMTWYGKGRIKPLIAAEMKMTDLKAAFARMATREVIGKIILINPT